MLFVVCLVYIVFHKNQTAYINDNCFVKSYPLYKILSPLESLIYKFPIKQHNICYYTP